MAEVIKEIESAIQAQYPIIYLNSPEEERLVSMLGKLAGSPPHNLPVVTWSCTRGFDEEWQTADIVDPVKALEVIIEAGKPGFYVVKDLFDFTGTLAIDRLLRDAYAKFRDRKDLFIFIISPAKTLPASLSNEIFQINVERPDQVEILAHLRELNKQGSYRELADDTLNDMANALCGLTLNDASHIMRQIGNSEQLSSAETLSLINESRKRLVASRGETGLEYVPVDFSLEQVGGLDRLKEWITARKSIFTHKAELEGIPIPKGILVMGISGCGKSMSAKVVARTWNVPLFRMDMNLIFSQMHDSAEAAFHKATQMIESAAPAILWIDEIENGLGLLEGGNISQSHVFSAFLNWMQEKPPLVFVAATANQIESLPAELIRKGRFDQVFFCDLPNESEREEILRIYIKAMKQDPDKFNLERLVNMTKGWNAAEIEQAVNGGLIEANSQGRTLATADITRQIEAIVPLSETMKEQVKKIRDWAWDRATPATKGKGRELTFESE